ncbi:MAG: 50S ribosomal protein L23 [Chloroflexi bacterium]|jgi:large subunit ribosomal protein L23|nr:50S ribosomal protein L23 [Chloroflexota bacterium]
MPKEIPTYAVLLKPLITEKGTLLAEQNKYAFKVVKGANKLQIKTAVETAFDVHVLKVNTMVMPGKTKRVGRSKGMTPEWKKAIVTLAEGERIEFFEGV